jgi:hypothetical protein
LHVAIAAGDPDGHERFLQGERLVVARSIFHFLSWHRRIGNASKKGEPKEGKKADSRPCLRGL